MSILVFFRRRMWRYPQKLLWKITPTTNTPQKTHRQEEDIAHVASHAKTAHCVDREVQYCAESAVDHLHRVRMPQEERFHSLHQDHIHHSAPVLQTPRAPFLPHKAEVVGSEECKRNLPCAPRLAEYHPMALAEDSALHRAEDTLRSAAQRAYATPLAANEQKRDTQPFPTPQKTRI